MRQVFKEATSIQSKNTGEMIQPRQVGFDLYLLLKFNALET